MSFLIKKKHIYSMEKESYVSIFVGVVGFLFLLIMKLSGQIDLNWIIVLTSFVWVPAFLLLAAMFLAWIIVFMVAIVAVIFSK